MGVILSVADSEFLEARSFRWLVSPRSTMVQPSPVQTGRTSDPAACLERLMDRVVRRPVADPLNP